MQPMVFYHAKYILKLCKIIYILIFYLYLYICIYICIVTKSKIHCIYVKFQIVLKDFWIMKVFQKMQLDITV